MENLISKLVRIANLLDDLRMHEESDVLTKIAQQTVNPNDSNENINKIIELAKQRSAIDGHGWDIINLMLRYLSPDGQSKLKQQFNSWAQNAQKIKSNEWRLVQNWLMLAKQEQIAGRNGLQYIKSKQLSPKYEQLIINEFTKWIKSPKNQIPKNQNFALYKMRAT